MNVQSNSGSVHSVKRINNASTPGEKGYLAVCGRDLKAGKFIEDAVTCSRCVKRLLHG